MEKLKNTLLWTLRIVLASTFIYAGFIKFLNPAEFFNDISNYRILPNFATYISAYFLPPFEIILALILLTRKYRNISLLCISALLLIFILALASTIFRGLDISCGCFGNASSSPEYAIFKNIILLSICLGIYLLNKFIILTVSLKNKHL